MNFNDRNGRRRWTERFAVGKLYYRSIVLDRADLVAKYSFVAHKSIHRLDLSLREFSSLKEKRKIVVPILFCSADPAYSKKFVNTAEGCRKTLVLERRWLYALHLDLPKGRESNSLSLGRSNCDRRWEPKTICFNKLNVPLEVYQNSLRNFIAEALQQKGMEMIFLRRQMALMKRVLGVWPYRSNCLEEKILNFLYMTCTDSNIVKEFLSIFDFHEWVLSYPKLGVLEYLLQHAYRSRFDLKLNDREGDLVNQCFFIAEFRTVELLMEYHNAPYYYNCTSIVLDSSWMRQHPTLWYPEDVDIPFQQGLMSKRRYLLWLQIFYAYNVRYQPPFPSKTLRLLWRSIPDAFFSFDELMGYYKDVPNSSRVIGAVHEFYVKAIGKDLRDDHPIDGDLEAGQSVAEDLKAARPLVADLEAGQPADGNLEAGQPINDDRDPFDPSALDALYFNPFAQFLIDNAGANAIAIDNPIAEELEIDNPIAEELEIDNPMAEYLEANNPIVEHLEVDNPMDEDLEANDHFAELLEAGRQIFRRADLAYAENRAAHFRRIPEDLKADQSNVGKLKTGQPRPLQHFCRTAIRKSLCYNIQLPFGIEQLRLPPKLKAYLRLES